MSIHILSSIYISFIYGYSFINIFPNHMDFFWLQLLSYTFKVITIYLVGYGFSIFLSYPQINIDFIIVFFIDFLYYNISFVAIISSLRI